MFFSDLPQKNCTLYPPDSALLLAYGANFVKVPKEEMVFHENQPARFFYKVESGKIKMCNYNEDGKEFIQGIFEEDQSFGEPPLFTKGRYPADAIAVQDSVLLRLSLDHFNAMLKENPSILMYFTVCLADRLMSKSKGMRALSSQCPEIRILNLLTEIRNKCADATVGSHKIDLTRQEIANMTGLRVETVIRTMKCLEAEGKINIKNRKVYI